MTYSQKITDGNAIKYFPSLTGVRAIAAYMVFLHHFNPFVSYKSSLNTVGGIAYSILNEMHIGVTLFFVLSGFLISLRYQGKVTFSKAWIIKYALNRFARIYQMYILFTLLTFFAMNVNPLYDYMGQYTGFSPLNKLVTFALNLSLLKSFFQNLKFTGTAQSWSLTVEECFYFTAPIFLVYPISRLFRPLLYAAICILIGITTVLLCRNIHFFGFFSSFNFMFCYTFFGRCFEFASGMILAQLVRKAQHPSFKHFTLAGGLSLLFLLTAMADIGWPYESSKVTSTGVFINNILLPISISMLYYGLITENSRLRLFLEKPLLELLGKSSYVFYLIHMGVIQIFVFHYFTTNKLFLFVVINIISVIAFQYLENPIHTRIRKLRLYSVPS